jgi:hypothetical protein
MGDDFYYHSNVCSALRQKLIVVLELGTSFVVPHADAEFCKSTHLLPATHPGPIDAGSL